MMKHDANLLSLALLKDQPKAAAVLLQEFPPEQAVGFLMKVPVELIIPVVDHMSSWPATRILSIMPEKHAAEILSGMPMVEAETLIRLMSTAQRESILGYMDKSLAKSFTRKLAFPITTVGAWMDTSNPYFSTDSIVNDCLDLIKRQKSQLNGVVFIVDNRRKFVGLVKVEKLLISENNEKLVTLVNRDIKPLPARSTLSEARNNKGWMQFPALPVVDRNNTLLGALAHHSLQTGTIKSSISMNNNHTFSLAAHMGNAFIATMSGFLRLISTSQANQPQQPIPPSQPAAKKIEGARQ